MILSGWDHGSRYKVLFELGLTKGTLHHVVSKEPDWPAPLSSLIRIFMSFLCNIKGHEGGMQ